MARRPYKFCANRPCSSWWNVKVEVAQQRLTRSRQLIFLFKRFLSNQSMCRRLYGVLMIFGVKTYKTPGVPENKPHEQWVPHARRQRIPTMKNPVRPTVLSSTASAPDRGSSVQTVSITLLSPNPSLNTQVRRNPTRTGPDLPGADW